jgi:hypothetical protein
MLAPNLASAYPGLREQLFIQDLQDAGVYLPPKTHSNEYAKFWLWFSPYSTVTHVFRDSSF